jgi:hypothetical protein
MESLDNLRSANVASEANRATWFGLNFGFRVLLGLKVLEFGFRFGFLGFGV